MINFYDEVKDAVTGFKGIVTGRAEYANGCVRYLVQSQKLKDEKMIEAEWIDMQQVEILKAGKVVLKKKKGVEKPGGPSFNAPKH